MDMKNPSLKANNYPDHEQITMNWSSSSDHDHLVLLGSTSHQIDTRSYTCSFCNRGFSNAQALGGHMNIHRKDRAKLREQAAASESIISDDDDENLLSLDISSSQRDVAPQDKKLSSIGSARKEIDIIDDIDDDDDDDNASDALSIKLDGNYTSKLVEADHHKLPADQVTVGVKEEIMKIRNLDPAVADLDLELRLGPEPHQTNSTRNTREFF